MQASTLKFPGDSPLAETIRREVARVISQLEIAEAAGATIGPEFANFLADAATKCPGYIEIGTP